MKKLILLFAILITGVVKAQVTGLATNSYVAKMNNNIINSLDTAANVYTYTLLVVSTNTGTAYTSGFIMSGSSNATISIPNGIYEIVNISSMWGNGGNHLTAHCMLIYSNTVTAQTDNTSPSLGYSENAAYFQEGVSFNAYFGSFGSGIIAPGSIGAPSSYISSWGKSRSLINVTNNILSFIFVANTNSTPGNAAQYIYKIRLKKLK